MPTLIHLNNLEDILYKFFAWSYALDWRFIEVLANIGLSSEICEKYISKCYKRFIKVVSLDALVRYCRDTVLLDKLGGIVCHSSRNAQNVVA